MKSTEMQKFKNKIYNDLYIQKKEFCIPCWICSTNLIKKDATVDHVIPKSKGGSNSFANFRICCKKCNQKKSNMIFSKNKKCCKNFNGYDFLLLA
jgi:5-methylcytosine-specific restriction endonuclease McrA